MPHDIEIEPNAESLVPNAEIVPNEGHQTPNETTPLPNDLNIIPNNIILEPNESRKLPNEEFLQNLDDKKQSPNNEQGNQSTNIVDEENNKDDVDSTTNGRNYVCNSSLKHKWRNLKPYDLSSYCKQGNKFFGIECAGCGKMFVDKKPTTTSFKPTIKKPMYACRNEIEDCKHAVCFNCYKKLMVEEKDDDKIPN